MKWIVLIVLGLLLALFLSRGSSTHPEPLSLQPQIMANEVLAAELTTPTVPRKAEPSKERTQLASFDWEGKGGSYTRRETKRFSWGRGRRLPPEDPIEKGHSIAHVHVLDATTREPLEGRVQLWRLDAPENTDWCRGDQLQSVRKANANGASFPFLPEGRYRAVFLGAERGAPYSGSFLVEGWETNHTLYVDKPGEAHVYLELYRANGQRLREVELVDQGVQTVHVEPDHSDWLRKREPRGDYDTVPKRRQRARDVSGPLPFEWKTAFAAGGGFALGAQPRDTRGVEHVRVIDCRVPGEGEMRIEIPSSQLGVGRLRCVFLSDSELREHALSCRPKRSLTPLAHAKIVAHPVGLGQRGVDYAWEESELELKVMWDGGIAREQRWKPADGPFDELDFSPVLQQ